MRILGIETSCDETAVALIEANADTVRVLGNALYSQAALHAEYGGVFPNLAKREHAKNLVPLLAQCLSDAQSMRKQKTAFSAEEKEQVKEILSREGNLYEELIALVESIEKPAIDCIAVTNGPGLEPALWVGVSFAKTLAKLWNIPVMPINHMEGHILVAALDKVGADLFKFKNIAYPALALLISGGHTQLVLAKSPLAYEIVGDTKDDAVGEAFDKVARILGLAYPGGPEISRLAEKERKEFPDKAAAYPLPRPMIHSKDLHFSFSGIKTAVLYTVKKIGALTPALVQEIACEFENAVVEVLVKKTKDAILGHDVKTLIIGGGVSANKKVRADFAELCNKLGIDLMIPEVSASTDNALMIALAGSMHAASGKTYGSDFKAEGNLTL